MTLTFYWTDILVWISFAVGLILYLIKRHSPIIQDIKITLVQKPRYMVALLIVTTFTVIGLLDSIHLSYKSNGLNVTRSVLDLILSPRDYQREKTYSAPFALRSFEEETTAGEGGTTREMYAGLKYAGVGIEKGSSKGIDILKRVSLGFISGFILWCLLYLPFRQSTRRKMTEHRVIRAFEITLFCVFCWITLSAALMFQYHIFGTDKIGRDVYYIVLKSIRTGLVIGTVTSFVMLPFALSMGIWAGYFRGWIDDAIQYLYTTLGSIPGVLLIAAAVLSFQIRIEEDPDLKLLLLCIVLGATGWIGLCRLLRGETLKLREENYVQAARTLGVSDFKILLKHILPNLMHIVIITVVIDFSGLVLAESVLSYVGVGVAPTTYSWGNMINAARLEMAREPMVWWSLVAAFIFMFTLVFSTNILGDALQQALNPRER